MHVGRDKHKIHTRTVQFTMSKEDSQASARYSGRERRAGASGSRAESRSDQQV